MCVVVVFVVDVRIVLFGRILWSDCGDFVVVNDVDVVVFVVFGNMVEVSECVEWNVNCVCFYVLWFVGFCGDRFCWVSVCGCAIWGEVSGYVDFVYVDEMVLIVCIVS